MQRYDLIVIGAGPGGYEAAIRAAQYGMKTAVIEASWAGGTCLNRGCIPTKTLMHSAQLYHEMTTCDILGIKAVQVDFSMDAIYAYKDKVVSELRSGIEFLLKANKIDMIAGYAHLKAQKQVCVKCGNEEVIYEADNILIAVGSSPSIPPIEGVGLAGVLTSNEILDANFRDFKRLTIIGGGVIGVEFASVFNYLGCEVTIIEAMERIVPTMDREISQSLNMLLKKRGINIYPASTVRRIEKEGSSLICHFDCKGSSLSSASDNILIAAGRHANTDNLFSDQVKPEIKQGIVVDQYFRTTIPGVYAIGDVIHDSIQLAHAASAQGLNAVAHMAGRKPESDLSIIPSCVYTNPEIASVGLTADTARQSGIKVKAGKYIMTGNGKSVIERQERGFIKVLFDEESDIIVGAQLMCARATDMVSELSTAITNKLTRQQLAGVIRPHPTFSEGITEAVEASAGMAIHTAAKR